MVGCVCEIPQCTTTKKEKKRSTFSEADPTEGNFLPVHRLVTGNFSAELLTALKLLSVAICCHKLKLPPNDRESFF